MKNEKNNIKLINILRKKHFLFYFMHLYKNIYHLKSVDLQEKKI